MAPLYSASNRAVRRCVNRNSFCDTQHDCATVGLWRTARSEAPASVQSVDRALTILGILARLGEAGVTEIAAELGVHKSTAFRLVATLESARHGRAERGARQVPPRRRRAAAGRRDHRPPRRGAGGAADLPQARRRLGETVNIAVLSDRLARSTSTRSPASPRSSRTTGSASTSRCTPPPTARCCCAGCRADEVDDRLPRLPSYTAQTVTTQGPAARASSPRCASRGTPSPSTSSRSG